MAIAIRSHVHARAINKRSWRNPLATTTAEFKKSISKPKDDGMFHSCQIHRRFFEWNFLKQVGHAKTRLPDERLCQPVRPYLLIVNIHTRKYATYPTRKPIFKIKKIAKQAYQHIHSTVLTHNPGAKAYTRETSRDASDTRVWYTHAHPNVTYHFPEIDWRRLATIASSW